MPTKSRVGAAGEHMASEVEQVRPCVLEEAIDIEHVDPRLRIFQCEPFWTMARANQASQTIPAEPARETGTSRRSASRP